MQLYVGAITGTSIDGLDIALLSVTKHETTIVSGATYDFPSDLQSALTTLAQETHVDLSTLGETDAALGVFIGEAVLRFLREQDVEKDSVRAVGSHGQTIQHEPSLQHAFSMQIGDPNRIAEVTGMDVIADLRSRDLAAGGQGAPLVPVFHDALFPQRTRNLVVLNVGGISNVTVLPAERDAAVRGFDTGPGNALMDTWANAAFDKAYDKNGAMSASGDVNDSLLAKLLDDPWLRQKPPKSTGKEKFNMQYVEAALAKVPALSSEDVAATLCQFTAVTVADAVHAWCMPTSDVVVCGGGRHNQDLMARFARELPSVSVSTSEDRGIDGDLIEAAAFGYLAHLHLVRKPGNVEQVTGAAGPRVLGSLYPAGTSK